MLCHAVLRCAALTCDMICCAVLGVLLIVPPLLPPVGLPLVLSRCDGGLASLADWLTGVTVAWTVGYHVTMQLGGCMTSSKNYSVVDVMRWVQMLPACVCVFPVGAVTTPPGDVTTSHRAAWHSPHDQALQTCPGQRMG